MAKISFALLLSLMLALPFSTVLGEYSWDSMIDQAQQAGISSDTIDDAKKAVDDGAVETAMDKAESAPSLWDDLVKNKAGSLGLNSPPNTPAEEPLLEVDLDSPPTESPENTPAEAPNQGLAPSAHTPKASTPEAATPQAEAPLGVQAPSASTPEAATPQAEAPLGVQAPSASTPEAATPQAEAPSEKAPSASAPEAETPQAQSPLGQAPSESTPGAKTPQAQAASAPTPQAN